MAGLLRFETSTVPAGPLTGLMEAMTGVAGTGSFGCLIFCNLQKRKACREGKIERVLFSLLLF